MSEDFISRQAAIDALGEEPEVWSENDQYELGLNNQWNSDIDALKAVPSAEPGWIPVTERLPKPNETVGRVLKHYLVQNIYGDMLVGIWDGVNWQMSYSSEMIDDAVAWMPLPECYRG